MRPWLQHGRLTTCAKLVEDDHTTKPVIDHQLNQIANKKRATLKGSRVCNVASQIAPTLNTMASSRPGSALGQSPRAEIAVDISMVASLRHFATQAACTRDEQQLQAGKAARRSWAAHMGVVHLQAPELWQCAQCLWEHPSHVSVVDDTQAVQTAEATRVVIAKFIQHVVVRRQVLQLRKLTELIHRQGSCDIVVRHIETDELRHGLPIAVGEGSDDPVVAQQKPPQLG